MKKLILFVALFFSLSLYAQDIPVMTIGGKKDTKKKVEKTYQGDKEAIEIETKAEKKVKVKRDTLKGNEIPVLKFGKKDKKKKPVKKYEGDE